MSSGENRDILSKFSSFSVILVMVVLMIVGAATIPLLSIQYTPTIRQQSLSISFSWPNASGKVIEQEVTSKIEGLVSGMKGIRNITSVSSRGSGSITLAFKSKKDIETIRFELASLIRRIYPKLPAGVSYPVLSSSVRGEQQSAIITYTLNAALSPRLILQYAENNMIPSLSNIEGVNSVNLSGATQEYIEIRFSPERLSHYSVSINDIYPAVSRFGDSRQTLGKIILSDEDVAEGSEIMVLLTTASVGSLERIPVGNVNGRIILLGDVATLHIQEGLPNSYYRVNGLNTINIAIFPEKNVNTLKLANDVKAEMARLQTSYPETYSAILIQDASEYIKAELNKIFVRTILCVTILLGFVFVVSRNLRYLFIITITLIANILIAFIFYNLFGLQLHLYSLAGVTVSLGIIIDTAIIMVDHYGYYRNRRVFTAILAALLTTIAALSIVFLLPEAQRANLMDFAAVIMINLTISLLIALLFVPALMDKIHLRQKMERQKIRTKRLAIKVTRVYEKFIRFEHRNRWLFILFAILAFGLPVHLLPAKIEEKKDRELSRAAQLYNKTIGGPLYQNKLKKPVEIGLGGTFRLFSTKIGGYYYREPSRLQLTINAGMPEGCTVQQLNEVIRDMENFLSQFEQIDVFTTNIYSYSNGTITVQFKKEEENGYFPIYLQEAASAKANNFGGATWRVYGITQQGFNNNISTGYKSNRIALFGYNYDHLYGYAEQLVENLLENRRVSEPAIYGQVSSFANSARNEYYIRFDQEKLAMYNVTMSGIYSALSRLLSELRIGWLYIGESFMEASLITDQAEAFDRWHLSNQYIDVNGVSIRLADIGSVEKRQMGNDIYHENQQYRLYVAFEFTGTYDLASRVIESETKRINEILPLGFRAEAYSYTYSASEKIKQFLLLILIIVIIYFIGAILFESLRQPFMIISLIPLSFIGVFLTSFLTNMNFDQGGFAAFVLLCGLVVNAGFYVISEYNHIIRVSRQSPLKNYLKAYNRKIVPIMLTIVSTILGLIPFLFEGPSEVFWYSFALGTMGGMVFNLIALVFFLPLFLRFKYTQHS